MRISKNDIDAAILKSYGSFENPNLDFLDKAFMSQPYQRLIEELGKVYSITDYTDLNYDRSFNYALTKGDSVYGLKLSMVGKIAFLYSLDDNEKWVVLTEESSEVSNIVVALERYGFKLMRKEDLILPIEIDIPGNEASIAYCVLFNELDETYLLN